MWYTYFVNTFQKISTKHKKYLLKVVFRFGIINIYQKMFARKAIVQAARLGYETEKKEGT